MTIVTKILDGIITTGREFVEHAHHIWVAALCLGVTVVIFGDTPAQGGILIFLMLMFLPAYFIWVAQKEAEKKRSSK